MILTNSELEAAIDIWHPTRSPSHKVALVYVSRLLIEEGGRELSYARVLYDAGKMSTERFAKFEKREAGR